MKKTSLLAVVSLCLAGALMLSAAQCRAADPSKAPKAKAAKTEKAKAAPDKNAKEKTMDTTQGPSPALQNPQLAKEKAPDLFKAQFNTTKGEFVIEVHRDWSPNGADRFYNLVKAGYYDNTAFFRNIGGFMVQFGINGDPKVNAVWREARIMDDKAVGQSNKPGYISFAMAGPNTRTTQVFISHGDNARLDSMGFTPFGKVAKGADIVASLYNGYGEGAPQGMGPEQGRVQMEGNAYLKAEFPKLDYTKTARIVK